MQTGHNSQRPNSNPTITTESTTDGGLRIRTNLQAGISTDDLQNQLQEWWQNLSNSMNIVGPDAPDRD